MTTEEFALIKYVDLHHLKRSGHLALSKVLETCIAEIEVCWQELGKPLPENPNKKSDDAEIAELRARLEALEQKKS